jgi:hypothetical protein
VSPQPCLFCGGDASEPDHLLRCDGRQGQREATSAWPDFDGETYVRERDHDRLNAQLARVLAVMRDHQWHTLDGVATITGDPPASVSARLRDLRKDKFGGLAIERRYVAAGLWEYRWTVTVQEAAAS